RVGPERQRRVRTELGWRAGCRARVGAGRGEQLREGGVEAGLLRRVDLLGPRAEGGPTQQVGELCPGRHAGNLPAPCTENVSLRSVAGSVPDAVATCGRATMVCGESAAAVYSPVKTGVCLATNARVAFRWSAVAPAWACAAASAASASARVPVADTS